MPMHNPNHPGDLIGANIEALGLNVAKAASALGVNRSQLHRVIKGESGVSPEMAIRLEAVIGGTADHWLRMQNARDLARIRNSDSNPAEGLMKLEVSG